MQQADKHPTEASNIRWPDPLDLNTNFSSPHGHLDSTDPEYDDGYGLYGHEATHSYYLGGYDENGVYDPELLRPGFHNPMTVPDITADFTKAATGMKI